MHHTISPIAGDNYPQLQAAYDALRPWETLTIIDGRYPISRTLNFTGDKAVRIEAFGFIPQRMGSMATADPLVVFGGTPKVAARGSKWLGGIFYGDMVLQNICNAEVRLDAIMNGSLILRADGFGVGYNVLQVGSFQTIKDAIVLDHRSENAWINANKVADSTFNVAGPNKPVHFRVLNKAAKWSPGGWVWSNCDFENSDPGIMFDTGETRHVFDVCRWDGNNYTIGTIAPPSDNCRVTFRTPNTAVWRKEHWFRQAGCPVVVQD